MKLIFTSSFLCLFAQAALAQQIPESDAQKWATGQQMAECAAYFRVIEDIAPVDKPASKEQAGNKARAWGMAAMMLLAYKSQDPQQSEKDVETAKKTEMLSRIELDGQKGSTSLQDDFNKNCMPLVPIQERIIAALRQGKQ